MNSLHRTATNSFDFGCLLNERVGNSGEQQGYFSHIRATVEFPEGMWLSAGQQLFANCDALLSS